MKPMSKGEILRILRMRLGFVLRINGWRAVLVVNLLTTLLAFLLLALLLTSKLGALEELIWEWVYHYGKL